MINLFYVFMFYLFYVIKFLCFYIVFTYINNDYTNGDIAKHRTYRKERKHIKGTKTSFPRE